MSKQNKNMVWSWARIFLAAVASTFLSLVVSGNTVALDFKAWEAVLISGLVAVVPVVINYLNPKYPMYGKGYTPNNGE